MGGGGGSGAEEEPHFGILLLKRTREATWSTRKFTPFVMQRISVAIQIAAASEIRQALGMSLALSAA